MSTTSPVSDADREHVVAQLREHVGAGRLTLDEFSDRARAAYHANTRRELADLTRDLPGDATHRRPAGPPATRLRLTPLIAVVVLTLLLGGTLLGATDAMTPWMSQLAQGCH